MFAAELEALRSVLPDWVVIGAWIAAPCALVLVHSLIVLLFGLRRSPSLAGLHWTEAARLHYADIRVLQLLTVSNAAFAGTVTYLLATGELAPGLGVGRALIVGLLVWLFGRFVAYRRVRRVLPWLTARAFLDGQLMVLLLFYPFLVVVAAMALLGPTEFVGSELSFLVVYGGGSAAIFWFVCGGGVTLLRLLGLARPADERLRATLAEVEQRCAHRAHGAWIIRAPIANAAALPMSNQVAITTHALEHLSDEQVMVVMLHEYGHLKEKAVARWGRLAGVPMLLALGLGLPLTAWLGIWGWLALLAGCFAFAMVAMRLARRLEEQADRHAQEHGDKHAPEIYARSLERLYELNLAPAVMPGSRQVHPHLYDRMIAAGVTPDYERPAPPPKMRRAMVVGLLLTLLVYVAEVVTIEYCCDASYDSEQAAMLATALSAGRLPAIGSLGYHWQEEQPEKALVVLRYCAGNSDSPEYPARLAAVLAGRDDELARSWLERAEQMCSELDGGEDWLREMIDYARERLELPPREW